MSSPGKRVGRFVDSLLRDRRPRRFLADEEEAKALLAAASLRSARPGADLPSSHFVAELERRLARELTPAEAHGPSRRQLLHLSGVTAAAALIGAALDRALLESGLSHPSGTPAQGRELTIAGGSWVPVMAAGTLAPGQAERFSAPAIEGFIVNSDGRMKALSAVCTHQGCILRFNAPAQRLDCPCHRASFNLEGLPLNREYLRPLPRVESRVRGGRIEVYAPPSA